MCIGEPWGSHCDRWSCVSSPVANLISPALLSSLGPGGLFDIQSSPALPSPRVSSLWGSHHDRWSCVSSPVANRLSPQLQRSLGSNALLETLWSPAPRSNHAGSPPWTLCRPWSGVSLPVANRQSAHLRRVPLQAVSVSDAESHLSRHEPHTSPEVPSEASSQPQLSPRPIHSQGPHAEQLASRPGYSASRRSGAKGAGLLLHTND